jgi:hypothetical protein
MDEELPSSTVISLTQTVDNKRNTCVINGCVYPLRCSLILEYYLTRDYKLLAQSTTNDATMFIATYTLQKNNTERMNYSVADAPPKYDYELEH